MSGFSLAWQFLTVLPWKRNDREIPPQLLGQSMAYYPAIGLLLGLILWAAYWLFSFFFPRNLSDGLLLLLLAILTGALHLDGLADTLDGMVAGKTTEERLRIMKDHRVGTFGVVGLILLLGLKFLALNSLPEEAVGKSLAVALVLSRWSMVQLAYRTPYARPEGGLGLAFKQNLRKRQMVVATITSLGISIFFFRFWGALIWLGGGIFTLGVEAFFKKKIGGFTGDILGAGNETNEVMALILIGVIFQVGFGF